MIILDEPYVSQLLKDTIKEMKLPLLKNKISERLGFVSGFETPLELRKLDYRQYPVFAFLFTETRNSNWIEIDRYLRADLKKYMRMKK